MLIEASTGSSVSTELQHKQIYRIIPELHRLEQSKSDISALLRIHNDPRVLGRLAGAEQTADALLSRARAENTSVFVFRGYEDNQVVGMVTALESGYLSVAQTSITGLVVDPELHGRGIASQGMVFTLNKLKNEPVPVEHSGQLFWVDRKVIYAGTKVDNTSNMHATMHLLESLGFENKGVSRKYLRDMSIEGIEKMKNGDPIEHQDVYKFELYLEDWPECSEKSRRILTDANRYILT